MNGLESGNLQSLNREVPVLVTGGVWALVTFLQFAVALFMQRVGA